LLAKLSLDAVLMVAVRAYHGGESFWMRWKNTLVLHVISKNELVHSQTCGFSAPREVFAASVDSPSMDVVASRERQLLSGGSFCNHDAQSYSIATDRARHDEELDPALSTWRWEQLGSSTGRSLGFAPRGMPPPLLGRIQMREGRHRYRHIKESA
jgi:hypothetical protein